jgi:protein-disulfide isomerase
MNRRKFIALTATGVSATLAGCLPSVEQVEELPRPVLGDEQSDVTVEVFEDLGCPACRRYELNTFPTLSEEYIETGDIRYEYYDYVQPVNPQWSNILSNACRAIQDRVGMDAFWEYKRVILENQQNISMDIVENTAEELGIEKIDTFVNDIEGGVYDPVIEADYEYGSDEYNVSATPTIVLNGQVLSSQAIGNYSVLSSAIDQEIANQN